MSSLKKCCLKYTDIFKNLPQPTLEQIDHIKVEKSYKKNEIIYREGEPAHYVWFVKTGRVRSVRHLSNGQVLTLVTLGPKVMFGICCGFSEGTYHCDYLADVDSVLIRIPVDTLKAVMRFNPEIAINLIENLSCRLHLVSRLQTVNHENVKSRLLYILQILKQEFGTILQITKRQIAEMAGTTLETCVRHMKTFEQNGMIASKRGKIIVLDLEAPAQHGAFRSRTSNSAEKLSLVRTS